MIFLRNLLRAPARSLMTALGIGAGVGLFVAISAIVADLHAQIAGVADAYSLEVVVSERRATSAFTSRISQGQMAALQSRYGDALAPMILGTTNERWNPYTLVIGAGRDFVRRTPLVAGAPHGEADDELMLGEIAAERLQRRPGQTLRLDGRDWRISGVYRTGSRLLDGGVMMNPVPAQRVVAREGAEPVYTVALMRARDRGAAAALIADVTGTFPMLKAIPGTEFAGSLRLVRVVEAFVSTISVVVLVGTCIVVANTLVMAIAERTREIGILMTVGWTPWLVLRMLMAESIVLCLLGAALGNGFALVLLRWLNRLDSIGFGWIPTRFDWSLAAGSFGLTLAVALVALVWPAVVLLRVQPLAALRHE